VADDLVASGLSAHRIAVVRNGIEPVPDPIDAPVTGDCVVLARHARNKNVALALNGFAVLLAREPQWPGKLVVVGGRDRCTSALLQQQSDLGLDGRVCWLERLSEPEMQALLRNAFCLISPSLMEGFDYPLLEAQSLGLPTLASRIPVHVELHRDATLFFELQDHGVSMASQLQRLNREPVLWSQLSKAGLHNAAAFTSHQQALALQQLLLHLLP
jgi:glycosyltransferase involved in cell wall biosynthesis